MSQYKTGLHKEVTAIFSDISPPKGDDGPTAPSSEAPAPGHQDDIAPKPSAPSSEAPAPEHQDDIAPKPSAPSSEAPAPEHQDDIAPKPSAPSHMAPAKPKPEQPAPQKAAPVKKPKANAFAKTIEKILGRRILKQIKNKLLAAKEGVSNTRQKVTVMLVLVLFIVLISLFIQTFSTPSRKLAKPGTSGPTGAVAADSDSKLDWQIPHPYPTTLRDPMQFGSAASQAGGLTIKGIVYSKDKPTAVIGNQIVHEGDKILDVTVVKINEDSVEFEANNKKWTQKIQK